MSQYQNSPDLANLSLGKATEYKHQYDPSLLQAVPRALNREELGVVEQQPFVGEDVWYGYELSWLNTKGKPVVALAEFRVPADSPNLVESKSFKLYLNSFNQTRFERDQVKQALELDLTACAGQQVAVKLYRPDDTANFDVVALPGECIDDLDIEVDDYDLQPELLRTASQQQVDETLHSHLLKSNCLITNQPDWGSVVIHYRGAQIDREALLRYLISFRQHNEFHEQCVERIFMDISKYCAPEYLEVQARYTRRGGLDINPFRYSLGAEKKRAPNWRTNRQ